MERKSVWPLLRGGKAEQEQGLELSRQAFEADPNPSQVMELGVALLWLKRYAEAWEHFSTVMKEKGLRGNLNKHDGCYGMAGVAKWCLGERREAVAEWVSGLKAKYVGPAGGVQMPLLLFYASVLSPEVYDNAAARNLMLEKTKDERIKRWPGPILQWMLAQIDDSEFLRHCQDGDERELRHNVWTAEFYRSLMQFDRSKISDYRESMRKLADLQQPEWQVQNEFLSRIWSEEYFLARFEQAEIR
jgi:hypothetical protein